VQAEEGDLAVQIHSIAALTAGQKDFLRPVMGVVDPDDVGDEDHPLFGAETEKPWYPVGVADELIELVRRDVEPDTWEAVVGADLRALDESLLLLTPRLQRPGP
jgi:hypothetical protein